MTIKLLIIETFLKITLLKEQVNKKLFIGSGNNSIFFLNKLHKRLNFAASELSAMQQNGGMGTEYETNLEKECKENIVNVIKDLIYAFDIKLKDLK